MPTVSLNHDTFESTVTDNSLVLVDFWASYCRPCHTFAPTYERSAQAHPDVLHAKVDTQAEPELAAAAGVRSIPTVMAFRDGVLFYNQPGAMPSAVLEDLIGQMKSLDMDKVHATIAARKAATAG
ncbi:Putative thioredoxin-2 [Mycobacterium shottsii]|uniref:Thiol reductase thioredoxin n=1 Tax=Mycobacterium shottsii TaxID=133549 RepID=A0A7I7LFL2_9MYCO|nr:thioredoxin family protein [Mycobacterium shottsii]QYL28585.1 Putative thioredoxin-2 [Mycobacterium shottsii]BBX58598.1 thiol reductase thioredoxin [Mycobacterium shottsii]